MTLVIAAFFIACDPAANTGLSEQNIQQKALKIAISLRYKLFKPIFAFADA